jgi:hypothetical protein
MHLSGRELSVLIAIAAHANAAGGCAFLSLATIAKTVDIDRSTIPPLVRKLEAAGLLRKLPPSGGRRTTTYQIIYDATAIGVSRSSTGDSCGTTLGDAHGNSIGDVRGNNIITESLNRAHEQGGAEISPNVRDAFERFWDAYPSRSPLPNPRRAALEAFAILVHSGIDPETLIEAAKRYVAALPIDQDPRFIPFAVNWLRREPFPTGGKPAQPTTRVEGLTEAEWRTILIGYKAGDCRATAWPKDIGLRPEHRATRVPLGLRREFGFEN